VQSQADERASGLAYVDMLGNDIVISLASRTRLFGNLDANDLDSWASAFEEMRFANGQALFARGDPRTRLSCRTGPHPTVYLHGQCPHADIPARGELFGEIAALDGGHAARTRLRSQPPQYTI
jgi:hypothetical protein